MGDVEHIQQTLFLYQRNALALIAQYNQVVAGLNVEDLSGLRGNDDSCIIDVQRCCIFSVLHFKTFLMASKPQKERCCNFVATQRIKEGIT